MKIPNIINVRVSKPQKKKKTLPIIYWVPKMHKKATSARFIIESKLCSTK